MKQLWINTIIICGTILFLTGCQDTTKSENINNPQVAAQVKPVLNTEPPVIIFEETELNFGQVGPGTSLEKNIKFINAGKGVLEITQIGLCCGVMASTDKVIYEPNETGMLKIEFVAPGEIGIFERQPVVYSNDPVNPKVILDLYCDVVQKVVWRPEKFKLFLNEENAGCPNLNIYCIDGEEFAITGFRSTGNCITSDYNPTVKKTEHVLKLKVDMDKLPEQLYGEISVSMNHSAGTVATVFFDVVPKYTLVPKYISERHRAEKGNNQDY